MQSELFYIILVQLLFVVGLRSTTETDSLSIVSKECGSKLTSIKSLSEFKDFMRHYRVVVETTDKPKKSLLNNETNLRKCFDQKDMLFALEELVTNQGEGVCQLDYVDKLIDYHLRSVVKPEKDGAQGCGDLSVRTKKSFAARIFSLFAHQVVLTCKSQLVDRISKAESLVGCGDVLDLVMPVDILRADSNDEKSALFKEFLAHFERVEDFRVLSTKSKLFRSYYQVTVSEEAAAKVHKLKELCRAREPFYRALFQPVSSLSELGYEVEEVPADSKELRCWLATGQFCEGILRLHLQTKRADNRDNQYVEIRFDEPPADVVTEATITSKRLPHGMKFVDTVDEFAPMVIGLVNKRSSLATKLKRSLKLAKKFLSSRVKIDERQNEIAKQFKETITRAEDDMTRACSLNGKHAKSGVFAPLSLLTDSTDSILLMASFGMNHVKAFIINMMVAVGFYAAFSYFAVFAGAKALMTPKSKGGVDMTGNFKQEFAKQMNTQNSKLADSVEKKGLDKKILGQVYVGSTVPMV